MRSRDRFNSNINEQEEQKFGTRITKARGIIRCLKRDLNATCAIFESGESSLIWGSFWRGLIAIESSVSLVSNGYIGSANAMLRQILEFLYWAKLGIEADSETLEKLNTLFYDRELEKSHPVTDVLKQTTICDLDQDNTGNNLATNLKELYHGYSFFTHATSIAQQNPYKTEDFYFLLNRCLTEICVLLDTFIIVFKQYCKKLVESQRVAERIDIFNIQSEEEKRAAWMAIACIKAGEIIPNIRGYHERLVSSQGDIGSKMQLAFITKWTIKGNKIKCY